MSTEVLNLSENEDAAEEQDIVIDIEKMNEGAKRRRELKNGNASDASKSVAVVPTNGHAKSPMEEESLKDRLRMTLLKKCSEILKKKETQRYTKESLHKTLQDEELVQVIFRLFDLDRKNYLVQKDWIEFLDERLTSEKQTDFVEQVTNVAFMACGTGPVTLDRFQLMLNNKNLVIRLFRAIDTDGDGYISSDQLMDFLSLVSSSRPRVGYDPLNVDRLEQLFKETVGDQREITREQFRKIFISKNPFFTERVFQIFDEDDSGTISQQEFITAVHGFTTPEDKLRFLFKVYDLDGNGLIQHPELQAVMRACMEENGMQFSDDQLMDLTGAMFEDADPEGRGAITYEAFQQQMKRHPGLLENLSITIDRWLMPPRAPERKTFLQRLAKLKPYQLSMPYLRNNYVLVTYLAIFFLVNIALFVTRCYQYRESNYYTIFARGCGQCLNFTCAWILMLMLRNCITWLRPHSPGALFPLDHHVYLHKLTGVLICVYSLVHTAMHLCNFSLVVIYDPVINKNHYSLFEWLLTPRPGLFGLIPGYANVTGVVLVGILLIMFVCSQPFIRRRGSFEVFYWTHLLYIPFWVLLIIHGPNFWKWFVLPGTLYVAERIMRFAWMRSARGKTYITSGILLPSRVTHVSLRRPPNFEFRAGDYVYVNVPAVAKYEWHPFTISSAPEQTDYIWLHIRGVGGWTNRLYDYFEKEQERLNPPEADDEPEEAGGDTPAGPVEMFRSSLRKSKRKSARLSKKRSVLFRNVGRENDAFTGDNGQTQFPGGSVPPMAPSPATLLATPLRLEKTCSMPDVRNSEHTRLRRLALRAYPRAESELRFGAGPTPAELRDTLLAERLYRSPHCRALAHSFRYMRNKPSIIAFEAPKEEDQERRPSNESIITIARRRLSKSISPDKDIETAGRKSVATPNGETANNVCNDEIDSFPIGKPLVIYLDGPYGAPSSRLFGAQHAVLIAAGIGVTPFASVLQSIMHRHWSARSVCPSCGHTWANVLPSLSMNLTKVDFFWINREQRSFEWFVSLLSQLEMEQAELGGEMERFLEMHMYITSALQRNDMKAVGLQLALDLLHEKEKRDLITGLKTRTNAGRPNWDKVFKNLQQQNKGQVTVFYCGPPHLAKILRDKCHQFGFRFRKEVF